MQKKHMHIDFFNGMIYWESVRDAHTHFQL